MIGIIYLLEHLILKDHNFNQLSVNLMEKKKGEIQPSCEPSKATIFRADTGLLCRMPLVLCPYTHTACFGIQ